MLQYVFSDGKSVPLDKYQECAEQLEKIEGQFYEGVHNENLFKDLLPFCVRTYAEGGKYGGTVDSEEFKKELKECNINWTGKKA